MKQYRIHFSSGETTTIGEADYKEFMNDLQSGSAMPQYMGFKKGEAIVNLNFITHVEQEESIEQSSHVVTPLTPDAVKRKEEFKKQQELASVDGLIDRHKKREGQ